VRIWSVLFCGLLLAHESAWAQAGSDSGPAPPQATPPASPSAESADDIYRRVFGKTPPPLPLASYPVVMSGMRLGEFQIRPPQGSNPGEIEARFLTQAMMPYLAPEARSRAIALAQAGDLVSLDAVRDLGIAVKFDRMAITLKVELPNDLRAVQELRLRPTVRPDQTVELIPPAGVSGYVTVRAGTALVQQSRYDSTGFDETAADLQMAVNIHGIVAEGAFTYDEGRRHALSREDVRLSYDDTRRLIRFEAGDLTVPTTSLQGRPRLAGASVFRNFGIDPYKVTQPINSQFFELNRPARVQVYINGNFTREFNLQGGRYTLRDLPLVSSASNDVELRIIYGSGETELLRFPAFFDYELLEQGLLDFGLTGGVPYRDLEGRRDYDSSTYAVTGYVRYGLTQALTVGANWQGDDRVDLLGVDLTWASLIGTFRLQAASNARDPGSDSGQASLGYRWLGTDPKAARSLDLFALYTGRDFRTLNYGSQRNRSIWEWRARYSQSIDERSRIQVYGNYELNRYGERDTYSAGTSYSRQFGLGNFTLGAEYRRTDNQSGIVARAGITIPFGRDTVTADFSSDDNSARIQYARTPDDSVGAVGFAVGMDRSDDSSNVFGRASYDGNRFRAEVEQVVRGYLGNNEAKDVRTRMALASSLVFADGQFALSRPVYDSFAMFKLNQAAGDYPLVIDARTSFGSSTTRYGAQSGDLGPGVLPDLSSYYVRAVRVDAPDAPPGSTIGGLVYNLRPGFRGGYAITVGSEAIISAIGTLVDASGKAVALAVGEVRDMTEPDKYPPSTIFTNGAGRFFAEKLVAGQRYQVVLTVADTPMGFSFDIPSDAAGTVRMNAPIKIAPYRGATNDAHP
jgi:outer membrane usher protein